MNVELNCPHCHFHFMASPDTPVAEILTKLAETGPRLVLGDGETFEDMIFNSLLESGFIKCPKCCEKMEVSEETLGQMAMEMLGSW